MRTAFINALQAAAARDERIWLVCGDLGFSVLERFASVFPGRFVNAGVAEQNMTGVAAGLAMTGKIVVTYSIANFPTARCLEQIRNDVCYHKLNVKIVAVGGGFSYGGQGYTHHGVEDLGFMRLLPDMSVFAPGDPIEARLVTEAMVKHPGPCYMRLGKAGEPCVHNSEPDFAIGKAITLRHGDSVAIVATGATLQIAVEAARKLAEEGTAAEVVSMPSIEPLDTSYILDAARRIGRIVTLEEHGRGGLGTAVAEVLTVSGSHARVAHVRLPNTPVCTGGSQADLRKLVGLTPEAVVDAFHGLQGVRRCA